MDANIESFENACGNGDLETVSELFDVVNGIVNMLKMRNLAVEHGYLNILEFLHKNGVNINALFIDENPLMIAAREGWIDIVDYLLLQPKMDINYQDSYGWTALMYAADYGQIDMVDRLLQNKNCKTNISNNSGNTAIFYATRKGYLEIVDRLIIGGSDIWHVNKNGETLLWCAIKSKNQEVLERVLSLGLDVNQQDDCGRTPLMYCAIHNNKKAVEILLEHGAIADGHTQRMISENFLKIH